MRGFGRPASGAEPRLAGRVSGVFAIIASELHGQTGPNGGVRDRDEALPLVSAECRLIFLALQVASRARFVCAIGIDHPPLNETEPSWPAEALRGHDEGHRWLRSERR